MDPRRIWSSTMLYGVADVAVLAVSGLLLLPLYTRTLTQEEFGVYVIVRANTEIFTYFLYVGLPSAMARVYFDYRAKDEHRAYVSSVITMFFVNLLACGLVITVWGDDIWRLLSPRTPSQPWLWFSFAIAAVSFFSTVSAVLLRIQGHVRTFAALQIGTSLLIAGGATLALVPLQHGLVGLLVALLFASVVSAAALPWLVGRSFRPVWRNTHVRASLHYAGPIVVGYLSYFVLNRVSMLVLQRHVDVADVAVFGLAQQLAAVVVIASNAFGKAFQPAVYSAVPEQAIVLLAQGTRAFVVSMFCLAALLILAAPEIFAFVAPRSYRAGFGPFVVLVLAGFIYSFTLVSDTAVLYARKPVRLAVATIVSAGVAGLMALLMIPTLHLYGAAFAVAGGYLCAALIGYVLARRAGGPRYLARMLFFVMAIGVVGGLTMLASGGAIPAGASVTLRLGAASVLAAIIFRRAGRRGRDVLPPGPPTDTPNRSQSWA